MADVSPNIQTAIDHAIQTALPAAVDNAIQTALPTALEAVLPTVVNDAIDDALTPETLIKKINVGDVAQKLLHYVGDNEQVMEIFNTVMGTLSDPSKLLNLGSTLVDDLTPEKLRALFDESSDIIRTTLKAVGKEDLIDGILDNRGFFTNLLLDILLPNNQTVYKVGLYASAILIVVQLYLLYAYNKIKNDIGTAEVLSPIASAQRTAFFVLLIVAGMNGIMLIYLLRLKQNYDRSILTYFWHFNLLLGLCVYTFNMILTNAISKITDTPSIAAQVNDPALLSSLKSSSSINSIVVLVIVAVTILAWINIGGLDLFLLIVRQLLHTFVF
jgi:hypothetical protein